MLKPGSLTSGYGYNSPSEAPPHHVRNGPNSGPSGHDVRIPPDSFRYYLRFGRTLRPRYTGSYDPNRSFSIDRLTHYPEVVSHQFTRTRDEYGTTTQTANLPVFALPAIGDPMKASPSGSTRRTAPLQCHGDGPNVRLRVISKVGVIEIRSQLRSHAQNGY